MADTAGADLQRGLFPELIKGAAWTANEYRVVVRSSSPFATHFLTGWGAAVKCVMEMSGTLAPQVHIIAASDHGAVPREAFVEKLGRDRTLAILPSLLSENRLGLRQLSSLALDLPAEIFAGKQPLYVLPTAAHLQQVRPGLSTGKMRRQGPHCYLLRGGRRKVTAEACLHLYVRLVSNHASTLPADAQARTLDEFKSAPKLIRRRRGGALLLVWLI